MKKQLLVLLTCLFVVMIGFGVTLPVLPFYVERCARAAGVSQPVIVLYVTLLTGVYALMQLGVAPLWGRWSDRIGRRPLIVLGITGYVVAQVLFGWRSSRQPSRSTPGQKSTMARVKLEWSSSSAAW